MISGLLAVDKPQGWTSHDVVGRVRRLAGQRQVGHAGTLDPLATGVLVLLLGGATRLSPFLMATSKTYCAEVVLGARTVTDDAEAPLLERCDVQGLESSTIQSCLTPFVGETLQAPPAYAAVRQGGQKLYQLARRGVEAQPEPRRVTVHAIDLLAWTPPQLRIRVRCGPGTYIRALARDIGGALGVGGYLHALRRTASGGFTLADCHHLEALPDAAAVRAAAEPPDRAVLSWPALIMTGDQTRAARVGRPVSVEGPDGYGQVRLYGPDGWLVALGERRGERIRPVRVFPPEAEGGRKA